MKALLLAAVILGAALSPVVAQKKSTFLGDIVVGQLTGKDETTREITIKYPGEKGPEIFIGILVDGYKIRMENDSRRDLKLNEIIPGMHIRVVYKSGREKINGQETKINKISRLEVLGNDEHARLRNQLDVDPSTTIAQADKPDLPVTSPLKIYPATAYRNIREYFVASIDKWNQKNGNLYGKLEVVSDLEQADISIVVARGADTMFWVLPADVGYGISAMKGEWSFATAYLVVKDSGGLKILWTKVVPILTTADMEASPKSFETVMDELEKRMKARSPKSKK